MRTRKQGLTVGDLSVVTDSRDSTTEELRKQRDETRGLSVGELYCGRRASDFPSDLSPSQEMRSKMQADHREKRQKVLKIQEYIFNQQQEKKAQEEAVGRRYADSAEFEKDVEEAIRKEQAKRRG